MVSITWVTLGIWFQSNKLTKWNYSLCDIYHISIYLYLYRWMMTLILMPIGVTIRHSTSVTTSKHFSVPSFFPWVLDCSTCCHIGSAHLPASFHRMWEGNVFTPVCPCTGMEGEEWVPCSHGVALPLSVPRPGHGAPPYSSPGPDTGMPLAFAQSGILVWM